MPDYPTYHPYYVTELECALAKGGGDELLQGHQKHLVMRPKPRAAEPDPDAAVSAALRRVLLHRRRNVLYGHALRFLAPPRARAGAR